MRCSASPTTCTVPDAAATARERSAARDAAARFEGMLFAKALAPVAKAMGFYGDLIVEAATESAARASDDGFTRALVREASGET